LIHCLDDHSWYPTARDTSNSKPRRYIVNTDRLLQKGPYVANYLAWNRGETIRDDTRKVGKVIINPRSGVPIPPTIISAYIEGTGFSFKWEHLPAANLNRNQLQAVCAATGDGTGEIIPTIEQKECGRIYSHNPALFILPKQAHGLLSPVDGGGLYGIDYKAQEMEILCAITNTRVPEIGFYEYFHRETGLSVAEVKETIIPIINGRLRRHLFKKRDASRLRRNYDLIIDVLYLPRWRKVFDRILETQTIRASGHSDYTLQRIGAEMLYQGIDISINRFGTRIGSPLFDGWIFPASNHREAEEIKGIFEDTSYQIIGQKIPVKMNKIELPKKYQ
jgi:hypothetical protein